MSARVATRPGRAGWMVAATTYARSAASEPLRNCGPAPVYVTLLHAVRPLPRGPPSVKAAKEQIRARNDHAEAKNAPRRHRRRRDRGASRRCRPARRRTRLRPPMDFLAHYESTHWWQYNGIHDGGLQFSPRTWNAYTGSSAPRYAWQASPRFQIKVVEAGRVARLLQQRGAGGASAWPNTWQRCSS